MVARAAELAQRPGHYATDRFGNPYIISSHRDNLGREIWEQTQGRVQGIGTATAPDRLADVLRPRGAYVLGRTGIRRASTRSRRSRTGRRSR